MRPRLTILISSAGRRVSLLNCFRESALGLSCDVHIIAVDIQPELSAACAVANRSYKVPPCDHADFVPTVLEICRDEDVKVLIPTIDPELIPLSRSAGQFSELGCRVVVSTPQFVSMANDKLATIRHLESIGLPCPATWDAAQMSGSMPQGPVVAKPRYGSSSRGLFFADSVDKLQGFVGRADYVFQERLLGSEYTINLFVTAHGFHTAVPHRRLETRSGEVSKAITIRQPELLAQAERLVRSLPGVAGPICFQAIASDTEEPKIFEINARFGGGYPICHRAGAHFTTYLLEEALGRSACVQRGWTDGILMLRYDEAVFVDPSRESRSPRS